MALLALLAACGGGPAGGPISTTAGYEPAPNERDSPGQGRDRAGERDAPPASREPASGGEAPPGGGGGGGCFQCQDTTYTCSGIVNGKPLPKNGTVSVRLTVDAGRCVIKSDDNGKTSTSVVFACGGKLTTSDGTPVGSWSNEGSEGVSIVIEDTQLSCELRASQGGGGVADAG